jgi:helicase associated protein
MEDAFPLGRWVNKQRNSYRGGKLSVERKQRLEALPGWVWNLPEAEWAEAYERLRRYWEREGSPPPRSYRDPDGFPLGTWVDKHRQLEKSRPDSERARRLAELPGWIWDPKDASWEHGYERLERYCQSTGDAAPPVLYVDADGFHLGHWVINQRQRHRRKQLASERRDKLEALPGWTWKLRTGPRRARLRSHGLEAD